MSSKTHNYCVEKKHHQEFLKLVYSGDIVNFQLYVNEHSPADTTDVRCSAGSLPCNKSGDTVAIIAAQCGHVSLLRLCSDRDLEYANKDGKRPLHAAAQTSQIDCVKYLLSRGVTVNCFKRADWTPLMLACTKQSLPVVRGLVSNGADLQLVNKDGWNCLHIAVREGNTDIVNYLLDIKADLWKTVSHNGRTPLHTAAFHGQLDVVRILLTRGQSCVDERDVCHTTPLMDALRAGHTTLAQLLIMHGADINVEDKIGQHSIHAAAQCNSTVSIEFLVTQCRVDVNRLTALCHDTPLHLAAKVTLKQLSCCCLLELIQHYSTTSLVQLLTWLTSLNVSMLNNSSVLVSATLQHPVSTKLHAAISLSHRLMLPTLTMH